MMNRQYTASNTKQKDYIGGYQFTLGRRSSSNLVTTLSQKGAELG